MLWSTKWRKKIKKFGILKLFVFGLLLFFFLFLVLFSILALYTVNRSYRLYSSIVGNKTEEFAQTYEEFMQSFRMWDKIGFTEKHLALVRALAENLPDIVGINEDKTYFLLLQNDRELRPTGGFLGSYAKLKFIKGGLALVQAQDIYVPDGQIPGHVEPPAPIQEAFKQGWWKLRDSNWDPDYPTAAKVVDWFFDKGNEEKNDGLIAINFSFFQKLIEIVGPINLPSYQTVVNKDNFYQIAQSHSEVGFFPGSTQKKDILSSIGTGFIDKIKNIKKEKIVKVLGLFFKNLNERQILIYLKNPVIQNFFHEVGWDGSMRENRYFEKRTVSDYLYLVEANLGANKANCCVDRFVEHKVDFSEQNVIREKLKIFFDNNSEVTTPQPPVFWGGNYINYLRIYLPTEAGDFQIFIDGKSVPEEKISIEEKKQLNLKSVGFFIKVFAKSRSVVEVNYQLPKDSSSKAYSLFIQKQPGIEFLPYKLEVRSSQDSKVKIRSGLFSVLGALAFEGKIWSSKKIFASFGSN